MPQYQNVLKLPAVDSRRGLSVFCLSLSIMAVSSLPSSFVPFEYKCMAAEAMYCAAMAHLSISYGVRLLKHSTEVV